jgi:hypothetical protein
MDLPKKSIKVMETLEAADIQELEKLGDKLDSSDPSFQTELTYDGYHSLEESDNDALNSLELERNSDSFESRKALRLKDRPENPDSGEESLVDPQENHK